MFCERSKGLSTTEKIDRGPLAHDLKRLMDLANETGLVLPENSSTLIYSLSEYHLQHQFRYPKNAGIVEIFSNEFAYAWTDEALKHIARGIGFIP
jgi:hypothetical protein